MKPKEFVLFFVFFACANSFSQAEIVDIGSMDPVCVYVYENNCYYVEYGMSVWGKNEYLKLRRDSYYKNEYGFMVLDIPEPAYYEGHYISINGKFFGYTFSDYYLNTKNHNDNPQNWEWYRDSLEGYKKKEFKSITSSKYLEEVIGGKRVLYEPWNLFMKFAPSFERGGSTIWINDTPPWAEGEAGSGIGAYIEIEFNEPVKWIYILNGYVDLTRQHLFYQNNRVKRMKVQDIENRKEYILNFEDYVYLQDLVFETETRHFKLIIDEVYRGSKYDDTCISAIYFRHDNVEQNWLYPEMTENEIIEKWSVLKK